MPNLVAIGLGVSGTVEDQISPFFNCIDLQCVLKKRWYTTVPVCDMFLLSCPATEGELDFSSFLLICQRLTYHRRRAYRVAHQDSRHF